MPSNSSFRARESDGEGTLHLCKSVLFRVTFVCGAYAGIMSSDSSWGLGALPQRTLPCLLLFAPVVGA